MRSPAYRYRRLTDRDKRWGPFTLGHQGSWRPLRVVLESGGDEYWGCSLIMSACGWSLRIALPTFMKPFVEHRQSETKSGEDYDEVHHRIYGFSLNDGFLQVFFGPQTNDMMSSSAWSTFLPWSEWRLIRVSLFHSDGELAWIGQPQRKVEGNWFNERLKREAELRKARFLIRDFDGEEVKATTHIEEYEWALGTGMFKWIGLFASNRCRRSLSINFDKEVGPKKGSWKGGTLGTSTDMHLADTSMSAINRYCDEHKMTLMGPALS